MPLDNSTTDKGEADATIDAIIAEEPLDSQHTAPILEVKYSIEHKKSNKNQEIQATFDEDYGSSRMSQSKITPDKYHKNEQ